MQNKNTPAEGINSDQTESESALRDAACSDYIRELARIAKQAHRYCDDPWYSCPLAPEGCADDRKPPDKCNCGATEHNEKVDALILRIFPNVKHIRR